MGTESEGGSLRDAIASAFDAGETATESTTPDVPAPQETTPAPAVESASEAGEAKAPASRDDSGRFAKGKAPVAPTKRAASGPPTLPASAAVPGATPPTEATAPAEGTPPVAPEASEVKPPAGWNAAEREAFKAMPREAQLASARREREYAVAIQKHAEGARFGQQVQQRMSPFVQPILAAGGNPLDTMENLFRTAHSLQTGGPRQRAEILAQMIDGFEGDLDLINQFLKQPGQAQGRTQPALSQDALLQQAETRVFQRIAQEREKALLARESAAVEEFGQAHEYFEDVADVMADLQDAAAKRGLKLSLEDAYARACALDPTVSGILQQRKAAQQAKGAAPSTQRARDAASSIRGQPTGGSPTPQSGGLRSDIEAAWSENLGR